MDTTPRQPERRARVRRPAGDMQATVLLDPEETAALAPVADLSACGIRLILDRRLRVGTSLGLSLSRAGRDLPCAVPATVIYVIEAPKGRWHTGCAFTRQLRHDELRGLL